VKFLHSHSIRFNVKNRKRSVRLVQRGSLSCLNQNSYQRIYFQYLHTIYTHNNHSLLFIFPLTPNMQTLKVLFLTSLVSYLSFACVSMHLLCELFIPQVRKPCLLAFLFALTHSLTHSLFQKLNNLISIVHVFFTTFDISSFFSSILFYFILFPFLPL
jgi:hypothetical protein